LLAGNFVGARLVGFLLLSLVAALISSPASGLTYSLRKGADPVILAKGEIQKGDAENLRTLLARGPGVVAIEFDSPGGSLEEGLRIGVLIRDKRLATRVRAGAECASACVYAFVGGLVRDADRGAKIGIHMASLMFADAYIRDLKRILLQSDLSLDSRIRLIVMLNEQMGAKAINRTTVHLLKMGVSVRLLEVQANTRHIDMHWLTSAELRDFNVTNGE
jgi:hypothetical protein